MTPMRLRLYALSSLVLIFPVHAEITDAPALLRRAQQKMQENIDRLPRYTCRQLIQRVRYQSKVPPSHRCPDLDASQSVAASRLATEDRIRLDVIESRGHEVFSWAGAQRFEAENPDVLIAGGASGSGDFGSFSRSLFVEGAAVFRYQGTRESGGSAYAEYGYQVPLEASHYQIRIGGDETVVAPYHGILWVDTQSAQLARLTVEVDEPPPGFRGCYIGSKIDLHEIVVRGKPFLLPRLTELTLVDEDGNRWLNRTEYSQCHEFTSESTIRFDGDPVVTPISATSDQTRFPSGLPVEIEIKSPIDPKLQAAGDEVHGTLRQAIVAEDGRILAPGGAAVTGRIMRLEQRYLPKKYSILGLRFESIQLHGERVPISLVATPVWDTSDTQTGKPRHMQLRPRGSEIGPCPLENRPGVGTFLFRFGNDATIKAGLKSTWLTCDPDQKEPCVKQ